MSKKLRIGAVIVLVLVFAALYFFFPVRQLLDDFIVWVQGLGIWGGVVFGLVYVLAAVLFVPGSVITLAAGFTFGVVWGTVIVSLSSTLGAALAFLIGRFLAQDWVAEKVEDYPRFHALYRAIDKEGFKTVMLARLVPIFPFGLLNYGFSVTRVPFWKYVLASWIGMFPATVMYVYFGSAAGSLARVLAGEVERTPMQNALFIVGGIAAVLVTVFLTRRARQELDKLTEGEVTRDPDS
ncbi:TVP38/TMEM64 family protein [Persicimonas caeni]|uniref:TVP38/TMEM64 family membrane protein n=1 Tax=Persicimonas caeni TaxID=2292766 RepID=A0A4Y6PR81_PERCE|nr:TVP38/TMEM64 family protein [Persicimonas caeni]QDG50295.1 TVP38/TMEM64 family protein [Persicimonas caeni]QED31516.1 TVP38/TMEM64 family protein [Persicimonas caeni]